MSWQGFRLKQVKGEKFLAIYECPVCGYDCLCEVDRCPHCFAYCMRWVWILNMGLRRSA